jgi:hypothetical protein
MKKLNRKACTNIFNTRARMIKVKINYRNQYPDGVTNNGSCRIQINHKNLLNINYTAKKTTFL